MGKITKTNTINHKIQYNNGEYTIEFFNDSFGPYLDIFTKKDCYFKEALNDRGTIEFPLKGKKFKNTEIFLETDDIIVAVGERKGLKDIRKKFIDIINLKTEKKQRFFTNEVNLIFNSKDKVIINVLLEDNGLKTFKTVVLDINSLNILEKKEEELLAFFKGVYNSTTNEWFILDFFPSNEDETDIVKKHQNGYFMLKQIFGYDEPKTFNREACIVQTGKPGAIFDTYKVLDIWGICNSIND